MATGLQIETVLKKVRDVIKAGIGAKLTAITNEMGDSVYLPAPATTSYAINELEAIAPYPFIQILPNTSDMEIINTQSDDTAHNILVIAHNTAYEGKIDTCALRTYRYARAIWEIIKGNQTLDDTVTFCIVESIDYKPMTLDGNMFIQEVWLTLKLQKCESLV